MKIMVRPNDPWRADEMDREAGRLDWAAKDAKDAPKPVGNFDDDYEVLCRYSTLFAGDLVDRYVVVLGS